MPFSKAYSELLDQESGHRVSVPVLASSSPSSVDDDDDLKKPQSNPEANDENFENNEMRCDIDERDSVKNFEEEKLAQKSSTDQNGKAQSKDNPLEQGHGDGKVTKDKDEGKTGSKTETVAIKETPKTDEASTKEEPQASVPVPTKTSSITESTPTRPPAVPQQTQDPVPTDSPDNPEPKTQTTAYNSATIPRILNPTSRKLKRNLLRLSPRMTTSQSRGRANRPTRS